MSLIRNQGGGTTLTTEQQDAIDSISNAPDNSIPVVRSGKLEKSLLSQEDESIVGLDGELATVKDTIELGQGLDISEDGGSIKFRDRLEDIQYFPSGVVLETDGTTGGNFTVKRNNPQTLNVQSNEDENLTAPWTAWLPVTQTKILQRVRMKFNSVATQVRITLRMADNDTDTTGRILFQSHTDAEFANNQGFTTNAAPATTTIEIPNAAKVVQGKLVYIVVEQHVNGSGTLDILGSTETIGAITQFYAWMEQDIVDEIKSVIAPMAESFPDDTIPLFKNGVMEESGLRETLDEILSKKIMRAKKFKTKKRSIDIGPNMSVSNSGDDLEFSKIATDERYSVAYSQFNDIDGAVADSFLQFRRLWDADYSTIQSDDTEISSDNIGYGANTVAGEYRVIITTAHQAFNALVQRYYVRANADVQGVRLRIFKGNSLTDPLIFESQDDEDFDDEIGTRGRIYGESLTGTVSITTGSATVTGVGTSFTSELLANDTIIVSGTEYVVKTVTDDTNLELDPDRSERPLPTTTLGTQAFTRGSTMLITEGGFYFEANSQYLAQIHAKNGGIDIRGKKDALGQTGEFVFYFERVWQDVEIVEIPNAAHMKTDVVTQTYAGDGSIANGGTAVTGTGTNFTTDFQVDDCFDLNGQVFTIQSITDDTNLTTNETSDREVTNVGIYRHGSIFEINDDAKRPIIGVDQQRKTTIHKNLCVEGDLEVKGVTTTVSSENVNVGSNYMLINDGYTLAAAQTGGFVVNYLPTATAATITAGLFTAGVASTSNPTVETVESAVFSNNELILISGTVSNDGIYEVSSHTGTTLTIKGVGTIGTVEDFTQNQFTDGLDNGSVTKVNVSILRSGTDGDWEVGKNSVTGINYQDLVRTTNPLTGTGNILFTDGSGLLSEDPTRLHWDNSLDRLGVGTNAPKSQLHNVGGALIGNRNTTAETDQSIGTNTLNIVTASNIGAADGTTEKALRLFRDGTSGTKYNMAADFEIGSYATSGINSQSELKLRMNNGATHLPDTDIVSFRANGHTNFIGKATFGGVIGVDTLDGSDTERLRITASDTDTQDNTRAASIDLHGNEHANAGRLDLVGGDIADITFWTSNTQRANFSGTGNLILENQIEIKGGAPAAGKVLTSDATGLATWEIPASGDGNSISRMFATPTGMITYNTGNGVAGDVTDWNTTNYSVGSSITNNGDGTFTLKGGRTYKLTAELADENSGTNGEIDYEWVDSSNVSLGGVFGDSFNFDDSNGDQITSAGDTQISAIAIYTPSVDTVVKVRFSGSADFEAQTNSRVFIEELRDKSITVTDGWTVDGTVVHNTTLTDDIGIGIASPNANAKVDVVSTTKGFMLPRWTDAEQTTNVSGLGAGDEGLAWFNTTTKQFMGWNGTAAVIKG